MIEYQFKDIMLGFYDGPHATPSLSEEGPVFLGIKNIFESGGIDFNNIRHISEIEFPKWTKRVVPQKNDIVFSYEATLHRYALIPEDFRGCLGRRMALIRVNKEIVNEQFLYQYFLSSKWRAFIETVKISGATVERISISKFPNYKITLPPLQVQNKIASILSAYDELIENNKQRIKLLEEMAEEIYKEWFVRLRFPGYETAKIVDGLPEGWEVLKIKELVLNKKSKYKDEEHSNLGIYDLSRIPRKSLEIPNFGKYDELESSRIIFEKNDILFGSIRSYFHKVSCVNKKGITNVSVLVFRPKNEIYMSFSLFTFFSSHFINWSTNFSNGTKMPTISWNEVQNFPIKKPSDNLLKIFEDKVSHFINEIHILSDKNQLLQETRDLLLPRLISGKLSVEHLVEKEEELAMVAEPRTEYK